eukprot:gene17862-23475_t
MNIETYRNKLFNGLGEIPDIHGIQSYIEKAWTEGFDTIGCQQLGGTLLGSDTWIGATECATLLRYFGLNAIVVDFNSSLAQFHVNGVLAFDEHIENHEFSDDSCYMMYGSLEENICGCYNVTGFVSNEFSLAKRDNYSTITLKSKKSHYTLTSPNSNVHYQSNIKSIHGDWTNGLKIKAIPSHNDVKYFWEILRLMSTYPQTYGSIDFDKSRKDIIEHVSTHKELWIIEDMTQVLSMEELGYVLSSQLK